MDNSIKTSTIFFSIVVPTYNRAHIIAGTINSLLQQTYMNYEVIVVDDGSTDNTSTIMQTFADPRLKYFKKINGERGAARNFGGAQAVGDYINFFDSDDIAYPNHLETAAKNLSIMQYPEFYYQFGEVRKSTGELLYKSKIPKKPKDKIITSNFILPNGVFVKKSIFQNYKYSEDKKIAGSEDSLLYINLFLNFQFHYCATITHCLIEHEQRSTNNVTLESLNNRRISFVGELRNNSIFMKVYGKKGLTTVNSAFLKHIYIQLAAKREARAAIIFWIKSLKLSLANVFSRSNLILLKYLLLGLMR